MGRTVSVWLPDWPVTVWSKAAGRAPPPDGTPFALVERGGRGVTLRALNAAARAHGLSRGQGHADARAILPALVSRPAEPEAEAAALVRLALWCERWSPTVAIDTEIAGMEGLFVEVGGAAHLFGGEEGLLRGMKRALDRAGVPARLALADSPGAAWALARFSIPPPEGEGGGAAASDMPEACRSRGAGSQSEPCPQGGGGVSPPARENPISGGNTPPPCCAWSPSPFRGGIEWRRHLSTRDALAPLPVEALRIDEATRGLARRFGFRVIGDLYAMPRAGLARRFRGEAGLALVARLDKALGVAPEPLAPHRPVPLHRTARAFAEPRTDMAGIAAELEQLAHALAGRLERDGVGARALTLTGFRSDGGTTGLSLRLGLPSRATATWLRLFREKGLDRLDIGFGVDALTLAADAVEPLAERQPDLDGEEKSAPEELAELVDRLTARLGETAVLASRPRASWLPERSLRWGPAQTAPEPDPAALPPLPRPRPILLLDPPEPVSVTTAEVPDGPPPAFTWRRVARRVVRAEGPERIAPEWWRGEGPRTRDYFRVEDEAGTRYWLFREGLYGFEDAGGARPATWWLHGVFA